MVTLNKQEYSYTQWTILPEDSKKHLANKPSFVMINKIWNSVHV